MQLLKQQYGATNVSLFQLNKIIPLLPSADCSIIGRGTILLFIKIILLQLNGFHIKMRLCNLSYTCFQS